MTFKELNHPNNISLMKIFTETNFSLSMKENLRTLKTPYGISFTVMNKKLEIYRACCNKTNVY